MPAIVYGENKRGGQIKVVFVTTVLFYLQHLIILQVHVVRPAIWTLQVEASHIHFHTQIKEDQ